MTYRTEANPRSRAITLGAVVAIHAVAITVLITGLAGYGSWKIAPVLRAYDVPRPHTMPSSQHRQHDTVVPNQTHEVVVNLPALGGDLFPFSLPTPENNYDGVTKVVTRAAHPLGLTAGWASAADYPQLDLWEGHEGTSRFTLAITADGRVSACSITSSSGWPGLDAAACRAVSARARFAPALDGAGRVMAGRFSGAIHWTIPD